MQLFAVCNFTNGEIHVKGFTVTHFSVCVCGFFFM